MPTLAPKLPWQHAFAGGYPRRGGQPLPTDPDAIDYLNRVAAADGGVSVEVGIAQAIDAFVRGCKADSAGYAGDPTRSNWDAIQASCIMCGARTLSGALVPLKGTAPTAFGSWASGDYSRSGATPGLKGNGSTKYLDSNRANDADDVIDNHSSAYVTAAPSITNRYVIGAYGGTGYVTTAGYASHNRSGAFAAAGNPVLTGLHATTRSSPSSATYVKASGTPTAWAATAGTPTANPNVFIFGYSDQAGAPSALTDARIAFYSIGSALDLAAMDERVTNLVTAIRFHTLTGLLPNDYDTATIAYITAAYAAGGTL